MKPTILQRIHQPDTSYKFLTSRGISTTASHPGRLSPISHPTNVAGSANRLPNKKGCLREGWTSRVLQIRLIGETKRLLLAKRAPAGSKACAETEPSLF